MIELRIADYCHNCPNFDVDVDKTFRGYYGRKKTDKGDINALCNSYDTKIMCKNRSQCEAIREYLTDHDDGDLQDAMRKYGGEVR